MSVLTTC